MRKEQKENSYPGWVSYKYSDFDNFPEVEVFSGGLNTKTFKNAAIWRQGNLLHFGFHETPNELNETGQRILLNAIHYIAGFRDDKPIAVTPSAFSNKPPVPPRELLMSNLHQADFTNSLKFFISQEAHPELFRMPLNEATNWVARHWSYLLGNNSHRLQVDPTSLKFNLDVKQPDFFQKALGKISEAPAEILALLDRVSAEPPPGKDDPAQWKKWFETNKDYLFFSELGGQRWYIDPLAKARGIPSAKLRGAARRP
jgi:hypothetical protein